MKANINFLLSILRKLQQQQQQKAHLKKYYIQRNKKFDQKAFEQNLAENEANANSINVSNKQASTTLRNKVNASSKKTITSANLSNLNLDYLKKRQNVSNLTNNTSLWTNEHRLKTLQIDYSSSSTNHQKFIHM